MAQQRSSHPLVGTTWRLVSLTMSGQTAVPDDRQKYTLTFQRDGWVAVNADCNKGKGRYTDPSGSLEIRPIHMTRIHCAPGSIADQFGRAVGFTQVYTLQNGQLLLGISQSGDTLRFEPSTPKK